MHTERDTAGHGASVWEQVLGGPLQEVASPPWTAAAAACHGQNLLNMEQTGGKR